MTTSSEPGTTAELVDRVLTELRRRGERVTGPRRTVVTLLAGRDDHLSADQIAAEVTGQEVHRSTVYRVLEALVAAGVVRHVHMGHGGVAYHLAEDLRPHLHLRCRGCGHILDAPADLLDDVARRLDDELGFRLDGDHVALTGHCRACG